MKTSWNHGGLAIHATASGAVTLGSRGPLLPGSRVGQPRNVRAMLVTLDKPPGARYAHEEYR